MANNDDIEEIMMDQLDTAQNAMNNSLSHIVINDINANEPTTSEEKEDGWIDTSQSLEETVSIDLTQTIIGTSDGQEIDLINHDKSTQNLLAIEQSDKAIPKTDSTTDNLNLNNTDGQHSMLHRMYHTQSNPSKEPYMRALRSERVWPRNLRRISSAPRPTETMQIVE